MKSDEDMALGTRCHPLQHKISNRLKSEDHDKDYDFKKDFLPQSGSVDGTMTTMQPWQKLLTACTTTSSNENVSARIKE